MYMGPQSFCDATEQPPDPLVGWGFPSPTMPMASRLGASIFGASSKVPLFVESKKSLNYSMQHCFQPFEPYVQTDINVTGLVVKGPRVLIRPRAPSRSVTPLHIHTTQSHRHTEIRHTHRHNRHRQTRIHTETQET